MTIKLKLSLLLFVPLLGLAVLGGLAFESSRQTANSMGSIQELTELAVKISATVHETQKERGRTAGYMGSKGENFKSELPAQHNTTDKKITELNAFLATFDASQYSTKFSTPFNKAIGELNKITSHRRSVVDLSFPASEGIGYYTAMHDSFLNAISAMQQQCSEPSLIVTIGAYVNFLKGKERAGIERAVMANTFAADAFGEGVYFKFVSLASEQATYIREFSNLASEESRQQYTDEASSKPFKDVENYRLIANENYKTGGFGVDASVWFDTITSKINKLKSVEDILASELSQRASDAAAQASTSMWYYGCSIFTLLVVVAVAGFTTVRSVVGPLALVVERLNVIANGDLTNDHLNYRSKDEIGQLAGALDTMQESLTQLVSQVQATANDVAGGATELTATAEQMSAGMAEQNSKTSQVAAAVEEMNATVMEVARKSSDASHTADNAGTQANEGGDVVRQTVEAINAIAQVVNESATGIEQLGKRSEEIGEVINVINDIADQTNLLALNAAIEAARAGEHGRGFAVVADEVRKLAERTTQATQEVGDSIKSIQDETTKAVERMSTGTERVEQGVELAENAGTSLQTIVSSSKEVSGMIQSIAAASEEQSAASDTIAQNVEEISNVTRQSAEATEQTTSAASQLSHKAEELQALAGQFKVN